VVAGAEAEARARGYHFILCGLEHELADEPAYVRLLTRRHVDGIFFVHPSTEEDNRHLARLLRDGIPMVTTAYEVPGERLTVVDVDNVTGGRQATGHLVARGHRRVATLTGPAGWQAAEDRAHGYTLALREGGIGVDPALVARGDWTYAGGYRAMRELLAREEPFSAIFIQNDEMAIGAMRALRERGLRVPGDISIVGYDDIAVAEYLDPPLTTVRQPMREVGALATRLLIEAIEEPDAAPREVRLQTELISRASCR
jgi:DNA-binding LacI/PurR family transcriptional regulator